MFYDKNGNTIREGSIVNFFGQSYVITKINGDRMGAEGSSTLTLDGKLHVDVIPDETNISVVTY